LSVPDWLLNKDPQERDFNNLIVHGTQLMHSLSNYRLRKLQTQLKERVPELYHITPLSFAELGLAASKSLLANLYLIYVYHNILDMVGNAGNNSFLRHYFELRQQYTDGVRGYLNPRFANTIQDEEVEISFQNKKRESEGLYESLADTFGHKHACDYFIEAYERLASQLQNDELRFFVLRLLPESALKPEFIQKLEKHVGRSLLMDKIEELQKRNSELNNEIQLRKVVTERLRFSETRMTSIIEGSMDAIILLDGSGAITHWNKQAEELFGYSKKEATGNKMVDLIVPPELREGHTKGFNRFMDTGVAKIMNQRMELPGMHKSGKLLNLELTIISQEIEEKRVFAGFIRDVSAQIEKDEFLQARHSELVKLNNELDQFLYSTSHDLRAPLTSVEGLITLMEHSSDFDEIQEYLKLQKRSVQRMDTFIKELADYSRNARLSLKIERIGLKKLITEITEQYEFMGTGPKMELSLDIPEGIEFWSDSTRLRIVLNNVLSNAYKYTDPNEAQHKLSISVFEQLQGVKIQIEDNGVGMERDVVERAFEMFYRASAKAQGSGLGLYIVDETVKRISGKIELQSELGIGTKVIIHLPNLAKQAITKNNLKSRSN